MFSNTLHYIEIQSVVGIIKDQYGRVLILKRVSTDRAFPGKWDLPGGKVDKGESLQEAIVREVKEETGLDVTVSKYAGVYEGALSTRDRRYIIHTFELILLPQKKTVALSFEHEDFLWVFKDQYSKLSLAGQVTKLILERN